jgi:predicted hydrocarbon binding protein
VRMSYSSPRRLCALAEGLIDGTAAHYGDRLAQRQLECMHRGDERCVFELEFAA